MTTEPTPKPSMSVVGNAIVLNNPPEGIAALLSLLVFDIPHNLSDYVIVNDANGVSLDHTVCDCYLMCWGPGTTYSLADLISMLAAHECPS